MASSKLSSPASPKISKDKPAYVNSSPLKPVKEEANKLEADTAVYESYLRLPELRKLWGCKDFPEWQNEAVIRPSLQALEITFRFISIVLSDFRPYINQQEWRRRLESLAGHQIELIATFCESEGGLEGVPVFELDFTNGLLTRSRSSEVWKAPGNSSSFVSYTSEASLLPRLASWGKSEDMATKIGYLIEGNFRKSPYTLGLGEPNLAEKLSLKYDQIVRPADLHALKKHNGTKNDEDQYLFTILQILESWLAVAKELLSRIEQRIDGQQWVDASNDCWILERIWKLLLDIEDMQLLMDTDDVLKLKAEMGISGDGGSFCFRSSTMAEVTRRSKELRIKVPWIVGVAVDPSGGPRVQEAAMRLFHHHSSKEDESVNGRIAVLQALQAVEAATKRFFFAYRLIISAVVGSLEAGGNRAVYEPTEKLDSLSQVFLEPPYFPSLDAAKTFLGCYWQHKYQHRH